MCVRIVAAYKWFGVLALLMGAAAWGQWTEPVRLQGPINNDPSIKNWPSIDATGDVLYYSKETETQQEDIYYSTRLTDSTWSVPIALPAMINTPQRELSPAIGPGDSVLYFVRWGGGYGSWDIWFSRRGASGQWQTPENAGPNVNTSAMEWGVFLSRDGRTLYFSSDHYPSEFLDIYKSEWQDSGGWGPAVRLPGHINSFSDDQNVTLPADESFLILTSLRYSASDMDFFYSRFHSAQWSEATRIPELSTNGREAGASLTPDGLTVYFASARVDSLPYYPQLYVSHRASSIAPSRTDHVRMGHVRVYPNPVNGSMITLSVDGQLRCPLWSRPFSVCIYDVLGRCTTLNAETFHATSTTLQLPFPALSTGKYWLRIDGGAEPLTAPFVILK